MARNRSRRGKKQRWGGHSGLIDEVAASSFEKHPDSPSPPLPPSLPAPSLAVWPSSTQTAGAAVVGAVSCVAASLFGSLWQWSCAATVAAAAAASLLLLWASWTGGRTLWAKADVPGSLSRQDGPLLFHHQDIDSEHEYHEHAYFADEEDNDDDMGGPRRGPLRIGDLETFQDRKHGRGRGRGGHSMHPGDYSSGERAGPDGTDTGSTLLGRRGSGRGRGRGRGRGGSIGGARPGYTFPAQETQGGLSGGLSGGRGRGFGYGGGWHGDESRGRDYDRGRGRGRGRARGRGSIPRGPMQGRPDMQNVLSTLSQNEMAIDAPPLVLSSTSRSTSAYRQSPERIRRARRAERAAQIYRETEDAARQRYTGNVGTGAGNSSSGVSSSISGGRSGDYSGVSNDDLSNSGRVAVANTKRADSTGKSVHFRTDPTQPQPAIFAFACSATSIDPDASHLHETAGKQEDAISDPASSVSDKITGAAPDLASATADEAMKRKSDAAQSVHDRDGDDSDDSSGFIMTRTAGKRRGNLSTGDMLANEILHDINEDLNTASEDAEESDPVKRLHRGYMNEAIAMAQLALRTNETPVGCVLIHNGRTIAKGMNATNITRNGTRHAELVCLSALFSQWEDVSDEESAPIQDGLSDCGSAQDYKDDAKEFTEEDWQNVDPSKGHLYPYGQKLHPARIVDPDIIRECSLYVTVEPCIMCASMLRQYGIKKVYFGAANDKFGGTGGVLRIHMNSKPNEPPAQDVSYIETYVTSMLSKPKRTRTIRQLYDANGKETGKESTEGETNTDPETDTVPVRRPSTIPIAEGSVPARDSGHGGNVEAGFDVEGGWGRDKAVFLLRQFYVQENGRAPAPRKKEGRAQRLVEQMKCESGSTVKLPPSAIGHQAELEAELDSLPIEASSPPRLMQDAPVNVMAEDGATE